MQIKRPQNQPKTKALLLSFKNVNSQLSQDVIFPLKKIISHLKISFAYNLGLKILFSSLGFSSF